MLWRAVRWETWARTMVGQMVTWDEQMVGQMVERLDESRASPKDCSAGPWVIEWVIVWELWSVWWLGSRELR